VVRPREKRLSKASQYTLPATPFSSDSTQETTMTHSVSGIIFDTAVTIRREAAQETTTQVAFQEAGKAQDQISPGEEKDCDADGEADDQTTLAKEGGGSGLAELKGVHRLLDHPGDVELEKISAQQGKDPPEQPLPVFLEIWHQQADGFAGLDQLRNGRKEFNVATFCLVIRIKRPSTRYRRQSCVNFR
jgi:hypothetical protein